MPVKSMKRYSRADLKDNPRSLFIFGDNFCRYGLGGQAGEARGERNAVGVRTKMSPDYGEGAFMLDINFADNVRHILCDMEPIFLHLKDGKTVVWPEDGIGTGLARLQETAPDTLVFINTLINHLKEKYGVAE